VDTPVLEIRTYSRPGNARRARRFYDSAEWRENHRADVLRLIEAYHTVALPLTPALRAALAALG
jgi:hypothetical protein